METRITGERRSGQFGAEPRPPRLESYVPGPGDVVLVPTKGLDRSALSKASSGLGILREAAELGLVGSAIPASGGTATSIPLDIGSRSQAPQIQYPTVPASDLLRYGSEYPEKTSA